MSYGPLVEIPSGYCFLPSCDHKPTFASTQKTSSSIVSTSETSDTTTVFGQTLTTTTPIHSKRLASIVSVVPMLDTHSLQAFPTDLPVRVGNGPVCIVFCEWARLQTGDGIDGIHLPPHPHPRPMPPFRPISEQITTSTITAIHRSTLTDSSTTSIWTITQPMPIPTPVRTGLPISTLSAMPPPQLKPHTGRIVGFAVSGLVGLTFLLGAAWLMTRQIRRMKAKLNPHTMGVHRDREREIFDNDGGKGIPELGDRKGLEGGGDV